MKQIHKFLGDDLSLVYGLQKFHAAAKSLLERVPLGATIRPLTDELPGAVAIVLPSHVRLVTQYDINTGKHRADAQLLYAEAGE
jgi:hypothetical protein